MKKRLAWCLLLVLLLAVLGVGAKTDAPDIVIGPVVLLLAFVLCGWIMLDAIPDHDQFHDRGDS